MSVFGQNPPQAQYFSDKSGALGLNGPVGVFDSHKSIKGTPYLFEEWYNGEITYLNDKNLPLEKLRYDIYKDELLVFRNKSEMGMLPKNLIKAFKINHPNNIHPLIYVKAGQIPALQQVPAEQFLQVLYQSEKTSLYARNWKTFQKADQRATYYTEQITDEFSDVKQDLFLVKPDGSSHEIKLRRGVILNAFSDQKSALKSFIKENQLQFEDTNDLVEVIKYYEQVVL
jgi:hypothetical protein